MAKTLDTHALHGAYYYCGADETPAGNGSTEMARRPEKTFRIVMSAATNRHEYTNRVWRDAVLGEYEHRWQAREALAALAAQPRSNGWALDSGVCHQDGHIVSRRDARDAWPRRWISQISFNVQQWTQRDGWL